MTRIEGLRTGNYKVLKDMTMGRLWHCRDKRPLTPLTAVLGKNGVGKSVLLEACSFLKDCVQSGVVDACDRRGGFSRIRSLGQEGPIELEIQCREDGESRAVTYELAIDCDAQGRPYVARERFGQEGEGQQHGKPVPLLILNGGKGRAWKEAQAGSTAEADVVELDDGRRPGIAVLGALRQYPRLVSFRRFVEGWSFSSFIPDAARHLPMAEPQRHLSCYGENIANVVQYMERDHPERLSNIVQRLAAAIPGTDTVGTETACDGRLLLRFRDSAFQEPLSVQQLSAGTLRVLACLLLIHDPEPPSLLCMEAPDNGLYHTLLDPLARGLRELASGRKGCAQVFITTHNPSLADALDAGEAWILEKGRDGFSTAHRASDNVPVRNLVEQGLPLGGFWHGGSLDEGAASRASSGRAKSASGPSAGGNDEQRRQE